jgi:hypothetical protein
MKFVNASKLDRKSGVRFGERGAPVPSLCGRVMTERGTALSFYVWGREETADLSQPAAGPDTP